MRKNRILEMSADELYEVDGVVFDADSYARYLQHCEAAEEAAPKENSEETTADGSSRTDFLYRSEAYRLVPGGGGQAVGADYGGGCAACHAGKHPRAGIFHCAGAYGRGNPHAGRADAHAGLWRRLRFGIVHDFFYHFLFDFLPVRFGFRKLF